MPEQERSYTPENEYDIQLKIRDLDYSSDLVNISIISSLSTGYQIFILELMLSPDDIILEDTYGKDIFKLSIRLLAEEKMPIETLDFELMYLDADHSFGQEQSFAQMGQRDRKTHSITTVCKKPFKSLNTIVNDVYINKTIREIITELSSTVGVKIENYDSENENKNKITQVCIPPISFYKVIKEYNHNDLDPLNGFLDQRYGIYDGVPSIFCQHDNKLYIRNLTKQIEKNHAITIEQISNDNNNEIVEKSMDGINFYTYSDIKISYDGVAKVASISPEINYIVKPKDKLYHTITKTTDDIIQSYSCGVGSKKIDVEPAVNIRKRYVKGESGNDYSEIQFNSRLGRNLSNTSMVQIDIERNILIDNLLNVGSCVKFKPNTLEYIDYGGKYILWSSEINFYKENDWQTTCRINLIRTNSKL